MFYKTSTQKQKAYDFYNSYKGDKVSRPTFYYRVRLGGGDWEEKIKIKDKIYRRRDSVPRGKRAKEMTWYIEQPEPKVAKPVFRNRLNSGYKKEEAILIGSEWDVVKRGPSHQNYVPKSYTPKKIEIKETKESDYIIDVTYPKEVAMVFRKEYQRIIDELEWELTYVSEKTEVAELNSKLERLYKEKEIFNSFNK